MKLNDLPLTKYEIDYIKGIIEQNYVSKRKIASKIKELELEVKECQELDKRNQYYDYIMNRDFAISKLYELLGE